MYHVLRKSLQSWAVCTVTGAVGAGGEPTEASAGAAINTDRTPPATSADARSTMFFTSGFPSGANGIVTVRPVLGTSTPRRPPRTAATATVRGRSCELAVFS